MDILSNWIDQLNGYLYSYILIVLLLFTGIFFTVKSKGVQFRLFPEMFRVLTDKATISGGKKGISSFQAFTISAASRIGTGILRVLRQRLQSVVLVQYFGCG